MKTVYNGQIVKMEPVRTTPNGNTQWDVTLYCVDETYKFRTKANAGWAQGISAQWLNRWANVVVSGEKRQIITDVQLVA